MPKLLTIEDICHELGIGRTTAYKFVRQIKHAKVGRRILVSEDDLFTYIRKNPDIRQNSEHTADSTGK